MLKELSLSVGLALAASSFVMGQQVVEETRTTSSTPNGIHRVSQILGSSVRLEGEDNYGKVEDIVLDDNGTIDYLVVAKDSRYVMLPWNAGNFDYGRRVVAYDVTPQAVQPLFFERNAWPRAVDQQFTSRIRQVFPRAGANRRQFNNAVDGAVRQSGAPVVEEKVKVKRNGDVKVKEKVK